MQGHPDDWAAVLSEFERLQKPKAIKDYAILCNTNREDLSEEVLLLLNDGWVLLGTPYVLFDGENDKHYHYQGMVKHG